MATQPTDAPPVMLLTGGITRPNGIRDKMLSSLGIQNFKGIKQGHLEDLAQVKLLVGIEPNPHTRTTCSAPQRMDRARIS